MLSGPPGIGKSTVAKAAAERLGVPAIDLDAAIEAREGRTSAAILRSEGEARFRVLETDVLEHLGDGASVIALGGGTLTTSRGRRAARAKGLLLGLETTADVLADRIDASPGDIDRPLLRTSDASTRDAMTGLLERRRTTYAAVDRRIDAPFSGACRESIARCADDFELIHAKVGEHASRVLVGRDLAEAVTVRSRRSRFASRTRDRRSRRARTSSSSLRRRSSVLHPVVATRSRAVNR